MFDPNVWAAVPPQFWAVTFFVFGCIIGSLLNVCIHRMPLGQSIITPRSHCPHCGYMIPGYLNIPLVTWLYLKGRCANCGAPISIRYFLVELLTGVLFMTTWTAFHDISVVLPLVYCVLLAGFIIATFIDFEHFIIPDEITLGGIVAGFLASTIVPELHQTASRIESVKQSIIGIAVGAGLIYAILRIGKLLFGRERIEFQGGGTAVFTETDLHLPDRVIPYEDMFYSGRDTLVMHASRLELVDRCYWNVDVRLNPTALRIGEEQLNPEDVHWMKAVTEKLIRPREAMGMGDVKFMAAIGAFLGWHGVLFSLMLSSIIGSTVGVILILMRKQDWSSRLPYGPYIALAATIWMFKGPEIIGWWLRQH